jgi:hypothetical protein
VYGPRSLRKVLLGKKDLFTINLSEKLLTYGTGRKTTIEDQTEAQEIADKVISENFGFRDLIIKIATSKAFSRK